MKRTITLIALTLVAACSKEKPLSELAAATPQKTQTAAKPAAVTAAPIAIYTASGEHAYDFTLANGTMTIRYAGADGKVRTIEGKQNDKGKRKYIENGSMVAEVKPGDAGGFKVKSADGKTLLWKVKRETDKVKISDNEENKNPFELKTKSNHILVRDQTGTAIGEVRYDSDKHRATVETDVGELRFTCSSDRGDRFLGITLLDKIPVQQRAIIMAELSALDR